MEKLKKWNAKLDHQAIFLTGAVLLGLITIGICAYLLTFLVSNLSGVLNVTTPPPPTKQFDIKGFEKLNLGG
ncbi:MAG: hypothetical protein Q7R98_02805 [Candidatus Jorgensenbacteria bacterium]|nr:hypothetical protein [Candidatus Jorgensenbacteria bacterium]